MRYDVYSFKSFPDIFFISFIDLTECPTLYPLSHKKDIKSSKFLKFFIFFSSTIDKSTSDDGNISFLPKPPFAYIAKSLSSSSFLNLVLITFSILSECFLRYLFTLDGFA